MSDKYDVIIIGAGIGGLVCGCYLAKAGLKVLIIEKNANPGGYCNSFEVKGYRFDGCVHSLGNLSQGGKFYQILNELGVYDKLKLERYDPSDVIISKDHRISFWSDKNKLVEKLIKDFPSQKKGIQDFFLKTIQIGEFEAVAKFRNKTFKEVLDEHFSDDKLKSMLALPVFGNMGVPAKHMNAFTAIKHYLQFLTDGGYYPLQGIQSLPNSLSEKFKELGGDLILSDKVEKMNLKKFENEIITQKSKNFLTKIVVSNCDAQHTFFNLIGAHNVSDNLQYKLNNMLPSLTIFTLYLGVEESFINKFEKSNYWYINNYDYDQEFEFSLNCDFDFSSIHWILVCPDKRNKTILAFFLAPFKNEEFWKANRSKYMQIAIDALGEHIPDLKENIKFKSCSTPYNLHQWTNSYKGAAYGWASIKGQFVDPDFTTNAINEDLYLCSQWSTFSSGVNTMAIVGEKVSQKVSRRFMV